MPEPLPSGDEFDAFTRAYGAETTFPGSVRASVEVEARQGYFVLMVNGQLVAAWQNHTTADLAAKNLCAALAGTSAASADVS